MFSSPIIAAPMAGGTSRPALVTAVGHAGALGFLAAGYKSAEAVAEEVAQVRGQGVDFGVNVFVPTSGAPDPAALEAYRKELEAEARRYQVEMPPLRSDDDGWQDKIALLLADPVPYVSFTFGLPPSDVVERLRRAGTRVLASVTSAPEALEASALGVDALVVQHTSAGAHSAAFLPATDTPPASDTAELVARVRQIVKLPLIAAGGIADVDDVRRVLAAGAEAAQLGTAFLRTPESGARQLHKDALADSRFTETRVTRAFTGRPARALVNRFVREHSDTAPAAYPMIHHLTAPIRAAAAAAGDADGLNLWAGTAWRRSRDIPAAEVASSLLAGL